MPAGWLQVDQQRHASPGSVEVLKSEIDPQSPSDGEQMHDRVGRPTDGSEGDDGVVEGLPSDDLGDGSALVYEFDRKPAGGVRPF